MNRDPAPLNKQTFDLLICGGGIYGAWTAYDAALRGLNVALIDQADWAHATSSSSSKLIHGGLRYLEQFEFKLVSKASTERERLMKIAPHRVWPLRFGVPVYTNSRVGMVRLKLGLMAYDYLAKGQNSAKRHRFFNRRQFSKCFPTLRDDTLKGGFTYTDAQTDDARLVLELVQGAINAGAVCVNYCKLTDVQTTNQKVFHTKIQDMLTGRAFETHARQIVRTTGRWMASDIQRPDDCLLTRGIHLVMPRIDLEEALLLTAQSDGRVFFVIPWYGMTLLGTTDTPYGNSPDNIEIDPAEIRYLLDAANHYLRIPWTYDDIVGCFAGIRVLNKSSEADSSAAPSSVSRDWVLKTASNGVHYSIGGKLTSARQDATQIVDQACAALGVQAVCATQDRYLPWSPFSSKASQTLQSDFSNWLEAIQIRANQLDVDQESALWLVRRHGCNAKVILDSIEQQSDLGNRIISQLPLIDADLIQCATHEMVVHLDDLLRRRLPLLILAKLTESELMQIAKKVSAVLNWDNSRCRREIMRCQEEMHI